MRPGFPVSLEAGDDEADSMSACSGFRRELAEAGLPFVMALKPRRTGS
jgi:hypothetical protein